MFEYLKEHLKYIITWLAVIAILIVNINTIYLELVNSGVLNDYFNSPEFHKYVIIVLQSIGATLFLIGLFSCCIFHWPTKLKCFIKTLKENKKI